MMDYVRFGERIRQERKKKGFSMTQLANIIGVTPAFMSHLEHGRRAISMETLVSLCNALTISPNLLLQDVEVDQVTGDLLPPASWDLQAQAWAESSPPSSAELEEPTSFMLFASTAPQENSRRHCMMEEFVFPVMAAPTDAIDSLMEYTDSPATELWSMHDEAEPIWETEDELPYEDSASLADPSFPGSIRISPDVPELIVPPADVSDAFPPESFGMTPLQMLHDDFAEQEDVPFPPDPAYSETGADEEAETPPPTVEERLLHGSIPPVEDLDWHQTLDDSFEFEEYAESGESSIWPNDFWEEDEPKKKPEADRPIHRVTISLEDHFPPEQMELLSELMTPWLEPPSYDPEESPCDLLCFCGPWGCAYLPFDFTDADLRPMDPEWEEWTQEAEMECLLDLLAPEDPIHEIEDEDFLPIMQRLTFRDCDPEDDAFPPALDDPDYLDDPDDPDDLDEEDL